MIAVLTVPGREPDVRLGEPSPADLCSTIELATGVTVEVDLADPERWRRVEVRRWDEADSSLLDVVVGPQAVRMLHDLRQDLVSSGRLRSENDVLAESTRAASWRRLAVIDALDWWLQFPLDQPLLDAERAMVRARAARTLRSGPLREQLTSQAMVLARRSAGEVGAYLLELADSTSSLPRALFSGLSRLANGYAALARQIVDGPDPELEAVAGAWRRLKATVPVVGAFKLPDHSLTYQVAAGPAAFTSSVDPCQLRARLVGTDLRAQEIRMVMSPEGSTVRVIVPAFGPRLPALLADRLMVRLVDSRSGIAHEPVLLTLRSGREAERLGASTPVFTEVVPLRGAPVEYLRADVFDADSEAAPAAADNDSALVRRRRAQFVLGEWRRLMAEARLSRGLKVRNQRLARLVDVLEEDVPDSDQPVFLGGPTRAEFAQMAGHPWFASTRGAGEPLVAELAAVYSGR